MLLRALSQTVLLSKPLKSWKGSFSLCLPHVPQDCEFHQCVITAAQAAFNLDPAGRSLTLVTLRVSVLLLQVGLLPG